MTTEAETIEWPGHGPAVKQQPLGMSDYQRGNGNANYITKDGYLLRMRRKPVVGVIWQGQFKNVTTKWFPTAEEAMANVKEREAK